MDKNFRFAAPPNASSSPASTTTSTPSATVSFSSENSSGCGRSNTANSSNHMANSIRALNKSSYKISKPISRNPNPSSNCIRPCPPLSSAISALNGGSAPQQQQPQPPVYNIDKNDFRDVVQKLTGSPAHLSNRPVSPSVSTDSPLLPPPARCLPVPQPLSRLHRIRPPPLAQLSPHPLPIPASASSIGEGWVRPPLSPLPPFPTVSAAAESPISAYMRRLHSGQPLLAPSPPGMALQHLLLPLSPLAFGCAPSPRSVAYQAVMSPTFLFPTSPGMPIPSPK